MQVSKYTGRIHLYSCIPGTDSRPQPLFENFRPEELESLNSSVADDDKEITSRSLKVNPAYRHALLAFINEWNKLRPIERRKLVGKSLQLPLDIELSYLNENINHSTEVCPHDPVFVFLSLITLKIIACSSLIGRCSTQLN